VVGSFPDHDRLRSAFYKYIIHEMNYKQHYGEFGEARNTEDPDFGGLGFRV